MDMCGQVLRYLHWRNFGIRHVFKCPYCEPAVEGARYLACLDCFESGRVQCGTCYRRAGGSDVNSDSTPPSIFD